MSSLSRATRGSSGKGKPPLASFIGIASSRVLPTSSAGYWSPLLSCENASASEETISSGGDFLRFKDAVNQTESAPRAPGLVDYVGQAVARCCCCSWPPSLTLTTFDTPGSCMVTP